MANNFQYAHKSTFPTQVYYPAGQYPALDEQITRISPVNPEYYTVLLENGTMVEVSPDVDYPRMCIENMEWKTAVIPNIDPSCNIAKAIWCARKLLHNTTLNSCQRYGSDENTIQSPSVLRGTWGKQLFPTLDFNVVVGGKYANIVGNKEGWDDEWSGYRLIIGEQNRCDARFPVVIAVMTPKRVLWRYSPCGNFVVDGVDVYYPKAASKRTKREELQA